MTIFGFTILFLNSNICLFSTFFWLSTDRIILLFTELVRYERELL